MEVLMLAGAVLEQAQAPLVVVSQETNPFLDPLVSAWEDFLAFAVEQAKWALGALIAWAVIEAKRRWSSKVLEEPLMRAALKVEEQAREYEHAYQQKMPPNVKRGIAFQCAMGDVAPVHRVLNRFDDTLERKVLPEVKRRTSSPPERSEATPTAPQGRNGR